ncbi:MAG: MarC family protein [Pseudomonadota bacterium]
MDQTYTITFFGALFAIMNPLVNLPIFLGLTQGLDPAEQRKTALMVTLYCAIACAIVGIGGQQILGFFGITVEDFRVAGGIVLGSIALHMLNGSGSPAHEGSHQEKEHLETTENVAFYPMTFPIIVGPGGITTLIVFLQQAKTPADYISYAGVVTAVIALLGIVLYFSAAIGRRLSGTLRVIMQRLMGMILLAIAVSMMAAGLTALFPGLASAG